MGKASASGTLTRYNHLLVQATRDRDIRLLVNRMIAEIGGIPALAKLIHRQLTEYPEQSGTCIAAIIKLIVYASPEPIDLANLTDADLARAIAKILKITGV